MNNPFALSYVTISLVALGFIYFVLCASLRREQFRCQVRQIRDELFDFMWENGHDYQEPAYVKARETMNTFLALSNKLSPTILVMSLVYAVFNIRRNKTSQPDRPLPDGPLGDRIRQSYVTLTLTLLEYSFLKGIPGACIRSIVWILSRAFHLSNKLRSLENVIVKDGADYLQVVGPSIQTPLRFT